MTDNRYNLLADGKAKLHAKERRRGWHFCWDYDGMLTTPGRVGGCTCLGSGIRKLQRIQKRHMKECSRLQRRWTCEDWPEWYEGDLLQTLQF